MTAVNETPKVRLDKYLWAIRMFKTRTLATYHITNGKVKLDALDIKASRIVQVGDVYTIKREGGFKQVIKCLEIIEKRVAFTEASKCYEDITPEEEKLNQKNKSAFVFNSGKRMNKQGRPTKRDRRDWDDLEL